MQTRKKDPAPLHRSRKKNSVKEQEQEFTESEKEVLDLIALLIAQSILQSKK